MLKSSILAIAGAVAIGMYAARSAEAVDFSFIGNFSTDDEVQLFDFTADGTSNVTLRSYSYAGGINAEGVLIEPGGFDPILALFDDAGTLIHFQDDAAHDGFVVPSDPVTGSAYDVLFESILGPGNYTVAISQYYNFPIGPNLSNGFTEEGSGNFTSERFCGVPGGSFLDVNCNQRTNAWAFDIAGVEQASPNYSRIPEPSLSILSFLVIGTIAARGALKKRQVD